MVGKGLSLVPLLMVRIVDQKRELAVERVEVL